MLVINWKRVVFPLEGRPISAARSMNPQPTSCRLLAVQRVSDSDSPTPSPGSDATDQLQTQVQIYEGFAALTSECRQFYYPSGFSWTAVDQKGLRGSAPTRIDDKGRLKI